jgi:HAD superfamily hydrolase (TIGR01484 family)
MVKAVRAGLLATDMDGTVIPPERTPERSAEIRLFQEAVTHAKVTLAYVTGRHLALALDGVERNDLPPADYLACDVGTSLYRRGDGGYQADHGYRDAMEEAFGGADAAVVRGALARVPNLREQEALKQAEFKASYYAAWPVAPELLSEVEARLEATGLKVELIVSRDPLTGEGLVDVLPRGVAKDRALGHLVAELALDPGEVVYAGDSGNDRAAFLSGYRAVVVGNAPVDLVREVRDAAHRLGIIELVYFARAEYAAGVLEGCRHHGLFAAPA